MKSKRLFNGQPRFMAQVACVMLLGALAVQGCTDTLVEPQVAPSPEVTYKKMRNAHLFGNVQTDGPGKVIERYAQLIAVNDFVLGFEAIGAFSDEGDKVIERYSTDDKVIERYSIEDDKVIERYSLEPGVTIKRVYRRAFRGFSVHVQTAHVANLLSKVEADPAIAWIEPDAKMNFPTPMSSEFKGGNRQYLPWGVDLIDADLSSARVGSGSSRVQGVDLFIIDTGTKAHDLNQIAERSFLPATSSANDDAGHGTHVAGTAAAQDNSMGIVGVAPGVNVHNFRVLDGNGRGDFTTVIAAVEAVTAWKLANRTKPAVLNLSLGGNVGTTQYTSLDVAVEGAIGAGVVVVVAAGNSGIDVATVTPAHVARAITVGAYDENRRFASFSNRGALVDLLAPGVNILSNVNATGAKQAPVLMSGTSMAAPHVAGAAALYLSKNPTATPQQVRDALVAAGRDWVGDAPVGTTQRSVYVGGF